MFSLSFSLFFWNLLFNVFSLFFLVLFLIKPGISSSPPLTFKAKAQKSVYNKILFIIAQCHAIRDTRHKVKMPPPDNIFQRVLIQKDVH